MRPGARRVLCATTREALGATAFVNPDGGLVVVAMNGTDQAMPFALDLVETNVESVLPAHSIATYVVEPS